MRTFKTSEVNGIIEDNNLTDFNALSTFIEEHISDYGMSTLSKIAEYANAKRENNDMIQIARRKREDELEKFFNAILS